MFQNFFLFVLITASIGTKSISSAIIRRPPVILVPGDGGSQLEGKLVGKPSVVHVWCDTKTKDWFPLWLNIELLAPYELDCTVDNLRLVYNNVTRTTSNSPGVLTRTIQFGNTSSVEWLDASHIYGTSYFNPIVEALIKKGYKRNVDIRGAPYDFRKAPNENKEFMKKFKSLIEETYKSNGDQKVFLIAHSMGNPYTLALLNQQKQSWKDKYVAGFFALSGPFAGAAKLIRLMASGDNLGVFVVSPLSARREQRSMPSSAWLMPYDAVWGNDVIAETPHYNYTAKDYKKFFQDIDFHDGYMMRQDTEKIIQKLEAPGVPVYCMHGVKVQTPLKFKWTKKTWYDGQPDVVTGDGDGTVNLRSLHSCLKWKKEQSQPVHHQDYEKVDHMAILSHKPAMDYILKVITTV